jgi:hypothetical protein
VNSAEIIGEISSSQQLDPPPAVQQTQEAPISHTGPAKQGLADASIPKGKDPAILEEFEALRDFNLSEILWDDAYVSIEKEEEEKNLTKSYIKALTKLLQNKKADEIEAESQKAQDKEAEPKVDPKTIDVSAEIHDKANRQELLKLLLKNGQVKAKSMTKFANGVGVVANTILSVKPIGDFIVTIPQAAPAALPWAGVCAGLQVNTLDSDSCFGID